jgi:hypothetical protein
MRTPSFLVILLGSALVGACGGSAVEAPGGGGPESDPSAQTATWTGTWLSHTGAGGTEAFVLTVAGGQVTGTVSFTGSPCFESGSLAGTLDGDTLAGTISAGGIDVSITGVVTGDQLSGTYAALSAGACTGDTGTFGAAR